MHQGDKLTACTLDSHAQDYITPFIEQDMDGMALRGLYRIAVFEPATLHQTLCTAFPAARTGHRLRLVEGVARMFGS